VRRHRRRRGRQIGGFAAEGEVGDGAVRSGSSPEGRWMSEP
jgi:hypothetical protein